MKYFIKFSIRKCVSVKRFGEDWLKSEEVMHNSTNISRKAAL